MPEQIKDGGPAFPVVRSDPWCPGMTLRAWLAGQSLCGLMANLGIGFEPGHGAAFEAAAAKMSCELADATIKALEEEPQ